MSAAPHLDDDQLSALLDGAGDPADEDHVATCTECSARLADWRAAGELIAAAPAPASSARRDAAVAAALAATVALPAEVPAAGPVLTEPRHRSHRRRPAAVLPRLRTAVATAAVLVVVAGAALVIAQHPERGGVGRSAAGPAAGPAKPTTTARSGAATPAGAPSADNVVPVPSLGRVGSPAALVEVLRADLAHRAVAFQASHAPPASPGASLPRCEAEAATLADVGVGTVPLLDAALTYARTPALVFVFTRPGGRIGIVVRADDCASLVTVPL